MCAKQVHCIIYLKNVVHAVDYEEVWFVQNKFTVLFKKMLFMQLIMKKCGLCI